MSKLSSYLRVLTTFLCIWGACIGTAQAACSNLENAVRLATLAEQTFTNPAGPLDQKSAREMSDLSLDVERNALHQLLDAHDRSSKFPEIMNFFAKAREFSTVARLYGSTEMRRYIQRRNMKADAIEVNQIMTQICADTTIPVVKAPASGTEKLSGTSNAKTPSPKLQIRSAEFIGGTLFLFLAGVSIVWRLRTRRIARDNCWIGASIELDDMVISGHISFLEENSFHFVCNPMQQNAAQDRLQSETFATACIAGRDFSAQLVTSTSRTKRSMTFRLEEVLSEVDLRNLLDKSMDETISHKKWRDLLGPRHSIST